jgi:Tfp pilus assembly protein PilF
MLAQVLQKAGQAPEAAAQLQVAEEENRRKKNASLATTDVILGTSLLQKGELAAAEAKFEEAVKLNPQDPLAQYHYGLALLAETRRRHRAVPNRTAVTPG